MMLAPQRGLTATAGKGPLTRPRPSATLSPRERENSPPALARPEQPLPSPHGRGKDSPRAVARPEQLLPSPRGEGGPRRALSPAGAGRVRGLFPALGIPQETYSRSRQT